MSNIRETITTTANDIYTAPSTLLVMKAIAESDTPGTPVVFDISYVVSAVEYPIQIGLSADKATSLEWLHAIPQSGTVRIQAQSGSGVITLQI